MICPKCKQQLPDGSKACPACGMSFVQPPQPPRQPIQPTVNRMSASQIAAQNELKSLDKNHNMRKLLLCTIASFMIALCCLIIKFSLGFVFFVIVSIVALVYFFKTRSQINKRREELSIISSGKQQVKLCPRCKSPNIQMSMVPTVTVTKSAKTTVSENINPLRPFTHVNVNHGPTVSNSQYRNKCHCMNCGNVFDNPEVVYQ